jgi:SAM-dependent methyltransferase
VKSASANLVLVPCPLCGNGEGFLPVRVTAEDIHLAKYGELYARQGISQWKVCGKCGFVHQNPRPSLASLAEFYANGQYHAPELPESLEKYARFASWYYSEKVDYAIAKTNLRAGRVLEIGCGLGGALLMFSRRGWDATGIEPDPMQARFASGMLKLSGVRQGLVDENFNVDEKIDLVFSNHAFEHLADLDSVARAIARVLKPGGHVFTAVPTYFSNRSTLSKQWMNSAHYSLFTHRSLNQLFAPHGLEEAGHTYRGWRKEIDDLWHVAKFTGRVSDSATSFEDAQTVDRYLSLHNPVRSFLHAPFYSGYARRVRLWTACCKALALFRESPWGFLSNLPMHYRTWRGK